ncbi:MAG: hypothetical protein HMLIMOIP_001290 [Candidatus Nitrosomirales archaeon]|jgi:hypothetical protein
MKIVLDTNVLVSALIKEGAPRRLVFRIIKSKKHQLITSEEILEEFVMVANEARIQRYVVQQDIADFLHNIATAAKILHTTSSFSVIEQDPDDDVILRTAYDARASYIVSGDRHLLQLRRFRRTRIVEVEEMLRILG